MCIFSKVRSGEVEAPPQRVKNLYAVVFLPTVLEGTKELHLKDETKIKSYVLPSSKQSSILVFKHELPYRFLQNKKSSGFGFLIYTKILYPDALTATEILFLRPVITWRVLLISNKNTPLLIVAVCVKILDVASTRTIASNYTNKSA